MKKRVRSRVDWCEGKGGVDGEVHALFPALQIRFFTEHMHRGSRAPFRERERWSAQQQVVAAAPRRETTRVVWANTLAEK